MLINTKGQGKRIILAELDESKRGKKGVKLIDDVMFADIVKMPYMIAFTEVKDYLPEGSPDRECFECLSTEMVPITEPNDTNLVVSIIISDATKITRPIFQSSISATPILVATPFPPRKPKNTGKLCPITTAVTARYFNIKVSG